MEPINGFLEYGLAAVLGTAVMMIFVGRGLSMDNAPGGSEIVPEGDE